MPSPLLFQSTDTGASTLTGQAGKITTIMDECLILKALYTAVSGGTFVNNTVEARLQAGTTFKLFQGPTVTNDEAYFGLQVKFDRLFFVLGTLGVPSGITLAWEYWNGAAWTALTVTDGTTNFSANGTVTWTIPGDWATTSVNALTVYWVRVRFTAGSWTTNPLVATASITGWTQKYTGTNKVVYQQGGGNLFYLRVQDDGNTWGTGTPSAATTKEALVRAAETATDVDTLGNAMPLVSQQAQGIVLRKSTTADATARAWVLHADDRTVRIFTTSGDATGTWNPFDSGDFCSRMTQDAFRFRIAGKLTTNNGTVLDEGLTSVALTVAAAGAGFLMRAFTGVVGAILAGQHSSFGCGTTAALITTPAFTITYPNGPDGGLDVCPIILSEITGGVTSGAHIRGRLRGVWTILNNVASLNQGDIWTGTGVDATRTFLVMKGVGNSASNCLALETSDTWDTSS